MWKSAGLLVVSRRVLEGAPEKPPACPLVKWSAARSMASLSGRAVCRYSIRSVKGQRNSCAKARWNRCLAVAASVLGRGNSVSGATIWSATSRASAKRRDVGCLRFLRHLEYLGEHQSGNRRLYSPGLMHDASGFRRPFPMDVMFPQLRRQLFADGAAPAYVDRCTVAVGIFSQFLEMRDSNGPWRRLPPPGPGRGRSGP